MNARPVFCGQKFLQKIWRIAAAGALAVAPESFGHQLRAEREFAREKFKQQFHQPRQGDAVCAANFSVKPVAETEKGMEWRRLCWWGERPREPRFTFNFGSPGVSPHRAPDQWCDCLLYTSDAADAEDR